MNITYGQLHRNVKIRLIDRFMVQLVSNMIYPFMVIYFSEEFGVIITGILLVINVILSLFAGFYSGSLSDAIGRKRILLYSEAVRCLAIILMVLGSLPSKELPLAIVISLMITSICTGISNPVGEALVVDSSESEQRKYIYSIDYWLWNISVLIGMMFGGFFFKDFKEGILILLLIVNLISIILLKYYIHETSFYKQKHDLRKSYIREIIKNYRIVGKDKVFLLFLLASMLELSVQTQSDNYVPVRLVAEFQTIVFSLFHINIDIDGYTMFGLLSAINTIVIVLIGAKITKVTKRINERYLLLVGILLYAIGYSYISFGNVAILLLIMMVVVAIGELFYYPSKQAYLAEIIPHDKRGAYLALNGLTTRGARIVGSLTLMLSAYASPFIISMEILLVGLLSMYLYNAVYNRVKER